MLKQIAGQSMPIRRFIESMQLWVDAVDNSDMEAARGHADQFRAVGRMLAADPEFRPVYLDNNEACKEENIHDALECMHAFLTAIADAAMGGHYRPQRAVQI